jgi:fructose-1,6-bisphosphatase/inositol monophosphatase family enzyme
MSIRSIAAVLEFVHQAGDMALKGQSRPDLERAYKDDGSVLTAIDRQVEDFLVDRLSAGYPEAGFLTEETERSFDPTRPFTFAIDPIDGTDAFSQGMPSWCICVGLLDHNLVPAAGIVYAPRWGSLFFADVGERAQHNGRDIYLRETEQALTETTNIVVHSKAHQELRLEDFPGKVRNVGSTALHLCFPLLYSAVIASISGNVHTWDIAAAHAINLSIGYALEYHRGGAVDYRDLVEGDPAPDLILSGSVPAIDLIRRALVKRAT